MAAGTYGVGSDLEPFREDRLRANSVNTYFINSDN
jgi:hypothetical protein